MSERSIIEGVWYMLSEILKSMIAVYIVSWIYQGINVLINLIGNYPDDHIGFALEPICFGIFFTIVYQLLGYIWDLLVILASKIFKKARIGKMNKIFNPKIRDNKVLYQLLNQADSYLKCQLPKYIQMALQRIWGWQYVI